MASSLVSLEAAGSPEKPGSSVIHLCMTVNRTVSGSVCGNLSVRPIAMSSRLSQPKVGGIYGSHLSVVSYQLYVQSTKADRFLNEYCELSTDDRKTSVIQLLGVVLVPVWNLDDDVRRSVGHGLATEARLRSDAGRFVQLIELSVSGFIAGFQAFSHDDVARRAGADAAASMVQTGLDALGNVEDAARNAIVAVRNFFRVDLDGFATRKKGHLVFLRRGFVLDFLDVRIAAAHFVPP